jgi:biotin carboxylase
MAEVPGPWLLKPRFEASAVGIKKINHPDELWPALDKLGDRQSYHLLERFIPGDIYHVDSIVSEREVVFAVTHRYGKTPFDVAHNGGVFTTSTLLRGSEDDLELVESNGKVLRAMGLVRGASHTEFIRAHSDGRFYFLETAARVGGANIAELVEAATNINLWAEWAKLEVIKGERPYELPPQRNDYAGLIVSLAKQKSPDTSYYNDEEVVWRMRKHHHAGLIVMSPDHGRIQELLADYTKRFYDDFYTSEPAPNRAQS